MDEVIENTVMEDWAEIEALFPTRRAMRPNKSWLSGLSTRAEFGRLSRVMANPGAGPLAVSLDQMDDARIKALRTIAAVNLEQAVYGFRATAVGNITVPALVLTVMSQIFSGSIGEAISEIYLDDQGRLAFLLACGFAVVATIFNMSKALAGLNQARDIRHVIDVQAAERGIYFGLEDIDEMHSA